MVESKFGTEEYKFNAIDPSERDVGGTENMHGHGGGKQHRAGVGGKGSKSHNFKEMKNANKRRFEKHQREEQKQEAKARQ